MCSQHNDNLQTLKKESMIPKDLLLKALRRKNSEQRKCSTNPTSGFDIIENPEEEKSQLYYQNDNRIINNSALFFLNRSPRMMSSMITLRSTYLEGWDAIKLMEKIILNRISKIKQRLFKKKLSDVKIKFA